MAVAFDQISPALDILQNNLQRTLPTRMTTIAAELVLNIQSNMNAGIDIDGIPFAPNTEATKSRKRSGLVMIESTALRDSWRFEQSANTVELFTENIYSTTMQYGAKKGQFGTMSNGQPIPWGDIPPRKMIPNDQDDMPQGWQIIIDRYLEPLVNWE
jgi:hypothetical protein